jgi:hypothetical protein
MRAGLLIAFGNSINMIRMRRCTLLAITLLGLSLIGPQVGHAESVIDSQVIPYALGTYGYGYFGYACWAVFKGGTQVSVTYAADAVDSSGNSVCGATVPVGSTVQLRYKPFQPTDIYWNATGYAYGTPYGEWSTTGNYAPWNTTQHVCTPNYIVHTGISTHDGSTFKIYGDLIVNTPSKNISLKGNGLTCNAPDPDGNQTCSAGEPGNAEADFNFGPTTGRIYGGPCNTDATGVKIFSAQRKLPGYNGNITQWISCNINDVNNIPVSQHTISCPITIVDASQPPSKPDVSANGSCVVGQPFTITMSSTASDNHLLRFGVDWLNTGSITQWAPPAPGYVPGTKPHHIATARRCAKQQFGTAGARLRDVRYAGFGKPYVQHRRRENDRRLRSRRHGRAFRGKPIHVHMCGSAKQQQ